MRVVIADDEPIALERLKLAVACLPGFELTAAAKNGREASLLIRELQPDIAVLDIEMPGETGLGVAAGLQKDQKIPEIVFVTAFNSHAVRAFELNAVDYVMKPVSFERFREAMLRAKSRVEARASDQRFAELQQMLEALSAGQTEGPRWETDLWVRAREGLLRLKVEEIDLIEAEGDYVSAWIGPTSHLMKDTVSSLEQRLDPALFLRVHRSYLVNLRRLRALRRRQGRGLSLVLESGRRIDVGPSYERAVLAATKAKRWKGGPAED
jgi:DNA-binding LytR/AlgR family response regulator